MYSATGPFCHVAFEKATHRTCGHYGRLWLAMPFFWLCVDGESRFVNHNVVNTAGIQYYPTNLRNDSKAVKSQNLAVPTTENVILKLVAESATWS